MICERIILNQERNVTLTCYRQEGEVKRPAIIVIPGGAYAWCSDREADPVAQVYLAQGYHAFILRYSVKQHATWPNPLNDYDTAMAYIRDHHEKWHIYEDKIAVIGFSAGGHLAAAAATMSKNRPNAALLGYAVAGEDVKACLPSAPDTTKFIDQHTCPCFIFSSRTDDVVAIENSLQFMNGLAKHQIAFESHIYAYGPHGFSTTASIIQDRDTHMCNRIKHWTSDSIEWLKDIFGDFKAGSMTEPTCNRYSSMDYEEYLSLDCTIGHIFNNKEAKEFLITYFPDETMVENAKKMTLRGVLAFSNISSEDKKVIEEKIGKIKNSTI